MLELVTWGIIGFISGSIPWALVVGKLFSGKDIRDVGDGNPGAANAWKTGGWILGILSLILDIAKGSIPIYFAIRYLNIPSDFSLEVGKALVILAPIAGHAWSPFLKFKGGKALATSWGAWLVLTNGLAFPIGCICLSLIHSLQKNHAITVTTCLLVFLATFLPLLAEPYVTIFGLGNLAILIWKHRPEYTRGIIPRPWLLRLTRAIP